MKSSTNHRAAYYRPDVRGLNPGDPATRTLDARDGNEYTYATSRLEVARAIAARHAVSAFTASHSTNPSK